MTTLPLNPPRSTLYVKVGTTALLLLFLTSAHHIYGAIIYETPWRVHIAQIAAASAIAIVVGLFTGWSRRGTVLGRAANWLAVIIIMAFPIAVVGLYEGGYNHIVKNVIYFGFDQDLARTLFAPPIYEMPNDFIFELTGIVQFPLSVITALVSISLLRRQGR